MSLLHACAACVLVLHICLACIHNLSALHMQELVKCIDDLREKREEILKQLKEDETEKNKIQSEVRCAQIPSQTRCCYLMLAALFSVSVSVGGFIALNKIKDGLE